MPNLTGSISLSTKTMASLMAFLDHAPDHGYVLDEMDWDATILFLLDHLELLDKHIRPKQLPKTGWVARFVQAQVPQNRAADSNSGQMNFP